MLRPLKDGATPSHTLLLGIVQNDGCDIGGVSCISPNITGCGQMRKESLLGAHPLPLRSSAGKYERRIPPVTSRSSIVKSRGRSALAAPELREWTVTSVSMRSSARQSRRVSCQSPDEAPRMLRPPKDGATSPRCCNHAALTTTDGLISNTSTSWHATGSRCIRRHSMRHAQ
jgi:hypothetical protein